MKRPRGTSVFLTIGMILVSMGYLIRISIFNTPSLTNNLTHNVNKYLQNRDALHKVNNGHFEKIQAKQSGNTGAIQSIETKNMHLQEINNRNNEKLRSAKPLKSSALRVVDNISNVAAPGEEGVNKCDTRSLMKVIKPYRIKNRRSPSEVKFQTLHTECDPHLEYVNPPGPVTALASFPGAGNTWTRHMIQQLTGELSVQSGYFINLIIFTHLKLCLADAIHNFK